MIIGRLVVENFRPCQPELVEWLIVHNWNLVVTLTHKLGSKVEKTGSNLELLETEVKKSAIEMDAKINALKGDIN